jgi:hypothetical protein
MHFFKVVLLVLGLLLAVICTPLDAKIEERGEEVARTMGYNRRSLDAPSTIAAHESNTLAGAVEEAFFEIPAIVETAGAANTEASLYRTNVAGREEPVLEVRNITDIAIVQSDHGPP